MTLSLILENAPHPQAVSEMRHEFGELSIGRSSDVDWQIDDPEMYVSRKHCIIRADNGTYTVTDASRGGLFIDGAEAPLGAGNSTRLEDGMRLRMGDYVIRVSVASAARTSAPSPAEATPQRALPADDFFTAPVERPVAAPRPKDMPPPFEPPEPSRFLDAGRNGARRIRAGCSTIPSRSTRCLRNPTLRRRMRGTPVQTTTWISAISSAIRSPRHHPSPCGWIPRTPSPPPLLRPNPRRHRPPRHAAARMRLSPSCAVPAWPRTTCRTGPIPTR